jgi:hypothetical protein
MREVPLLTEMPLRTHDATSTRSGVQQTAVAAEERERQPLGEHTLMWLEEVYTVYVTYEGCRGDRQEEDDERTAQDA